MSGHWIRDGRLNVPLGVYYSLRSAWLFPIMLTIAWVRGRWAALAAYWVAIGLAVVPGLLVVDVSRCVALCWPAVLIALRHLYHENPRVTGHWLTAAVALNVCTPVYNVYGKVIHPMVPLPIALVFAPW
jgi:hypothetical protein